MDTVNNLIKSDIISEKNVQWSAKLVLFLLLLGPVIFTFCLCLYLFKRYNKKRFRKERERYDDLEYQRSDTSEVSDPIFEANLKKIKLHKNTRSELKSDQRRKLLDKLREKHGIETKEADNENEDRQKARLYKIESKKWKRKYNRLKQRLERIKEADQSSERSDLKENKKNDGIESEEVDSDKKEAKISANSNYPKLTTYEDTKATASESLTLSELSESDQKDGKEPLIFNENKF